MILRPIAAHARTSRPRRWATTPRCRRSPGARGPLYSYFRQRFAQVTNPPIDHLRERHDVLPAHDPRRSGDAARRKGRRPPAAPSSRASSSTRTRSSGSAHAPRRDVRGATSRPRCVRLADEAEASVRAGRTWLLVISDTGGPAHAGSDAAGGRRRPPPPRRRAACGPSPRSSSRPTRRARHTTSPACSATAPRRSARGSRSRRSPRSPRRTRWAATGLRPAEAQERFRAAIEDGVLKVMSKMGISDVAAYCGAQVFDASASRPRSSSSASPARRRRSAASASPSSSAEALDRARRRRGSRAPATSSSARAASRTRPTRTWSRPPTRSALAVRERAAGARTSASPSSSTAGRRWSSATCSSSFRRPSRCRSTRSSRRSRSSSGSRPGGMSHGALSAEAHETIAIAFNRLARALELRRGRRGPGPLPHRAELADQADRLRPLRRHAGVRGLRRRAADQDRAGLEARRGRPAARAQGLGRDRAAAAHAARASR